MLKGRCRMVCRRLEVAEVFGVAFASSAGTAVKIQARSFLHWGEVYPEKLGVTMAADSLILIVDAGGVDKRRCGKCLSLLYRTGYEGREPSVSSG